jgi:uncharacterized membrane protein
MAEQPANVAYDLVVFSFPGEKRAGEVVKLMRSEGKAAGLKVKAWAVVSVDEKGKSHVDSSGHGGIGAGVGAGVGAILGLIGGPAGLLVWTLGAAALGGVAGKKLGAFLPADELKAIGAQMAPNSSGLIVVIEDQNLKAAMDEMGAQGASVLTVTLGDQASGELAQYAAVDLGETEPEAEAPAAEEPKQ